MPRHAILAGLAALLLTAPRPALAQAPTFDLSFPVSGDAALDATAESGDIVVRSGEGSSIQVRGRVEVRREWKVPSNAAALARQVAAQPPVSQNGQTVTLARIADEATRRAVSISYEVTVPARTAVTARSGSGDIDVDGVAGMARVNTGSGSVRARGIGAGLHASTGSGDIDATLTGQGDVQTSTGSGSICLAGVVGALQASTGSGDVDVTGTPTGTWKLSTASGRVGIDVPDDAGFTLDARTSSGSLNLDVPLTTQGRMDRRRVQGQVRGGGPALELSTASGSISVR